MCALVTGFHTCALPISGFQVAVAQRCGQFAAHAGGAHVARAGVDPGTARAVDAGIAGADLELHGHAVRHAGLQLHVGVVPAEQGEPAELAFALPGDDQPVAGFVQSPDTPPTVAPPPTTSASTPEK